MFKLLKNLALSVVLACLPLQSMATPALSLLCDSAVAGGAGHAHAQAAADVDDDLHHAAMHVGDAGHEHPAGQADSGSQVHPCCDHHYSALPALASGVVAVPASLQPAGLVQALRPHFPEQPHHPPSL